MVIVVMGVTGSGKTVVGRRLADRLGLPFHDADDFHPAENVARMSAGQPLTDEERYPWLENLASHLVDWDAGGGAVLACSALKQSYRNILRQGSPDLQFVYLKAAPALVRERIERRTDHYMPAELVDSQFEILEEPEEAIEVDAALELEQVVDHIMTRLPRA